MTTPGSVPVEEALSGDKSHGRRAGGTRRQAHHRSGSLPVPSKPGRMWRIWQRVEVIARIDPRDLIICRVRGAGRIRGGLAWQET
jgi:hypothetical protein